MTKYIVIDTETSGLPRYKDAEGKPIPADAEGQPRLAELAMIFLDDSLRTEREIARYVRPDNWTMDPEATAANGLTTEFLNEHGHAIGEVLEMYRAAIEDEGRIVLAYGAQFDCKILRGELRRAGMDDMFAITRNSCLMRACGSLPEGQRITKANGRPGFPGLADACKHFDIAQESAHTGMGDARAAAALARILHAKGWLQPPAVHKAKDRD